MKDPLIAIAAGIAILSAGASSIGEGLLCAKAIEGMQIVKELYVKGRLVNIVVKPQ